MVGVGEKCVTEEWEGILPESSETSGGQDQSILGWIMGDVDDPSMANLNKVLQIGGGGGGLSADFDFNGGFGVVDQVLGDDSLGQNPMFPSLACNLGTFEFNQEGQQQQVMQQSLPFVSEEIKSPIFNPQFLVNQNQTQHSQNPSFCMPLPCGQQLQSLLMPPHAKRHNPETLGDNEPGCRIPKRQFSDTGQDQHQQMLQGLPQQLQLFPHYLQQRPDPRPKFVEGDISHQQQQEQAIVDQLYKVAGLVQAGNALVAQTILARLNHQLYPTGKPFYRAAFYVKETLQLLLQSSNFHPCAVTTPLDIIFKIGAYKSFSEISPIVQFANFTCNQALLEVLEGFDRIHIIDFEIGYGTQWASLMQELALRSGGPPSLRITTFTSPSSQSQLELGLTQESLLQFASEINMSFEFEILSIDSLNSTMWSMPFPVSENEAIAVNFPVSSFTNNQFSLPVVLRFIKQLSPKILVSIDRGCDRIDLPFPNHVIHALQSYSNLLESIDAGNVNLDSLQKIETLLIQPGIERTLFSRYHTPDKTQHWRALFLSSGFSPLTFSNFTESQADCLVKRTHVRGFHVEKRQSSLMLCWQRKELISASAWRC